MAATYPPGQVSLLGTRRLEANRYPQITFVAPNGTKFYLAGPMAPTPGAQEGVTALSVQGLQPPFKHIDTQGARQDGITWTDTVYDPGEIDMILEASGLTAGDTRRVVRSWIGAWDPKLLGRLHVFTPEGGEWWARVRSLKSFNDQITMSGDGSDKQKFTWAVRNDDAFWESFDSTGSFQLSLSSASDTFDGAIAPNLGAGWSQLYKGSGAGTCGLSGDGMAKWTRSGFLPREVINRKIGTGATSSTDNQVITVKFNAPVGIDLLGGVYADIWGRMDSSGNGIRARIGGQGIIHGVRLSYFKAGVETVMYERPLFIGPLWNEKWTLICGTTAGERNFKVQRGDGHTVINYTENGTNSNKGATHRGWGFGMAAGDGLDIPGTLYDILQTPPPPIEKWTAGDNIVATQSGFIPLVNRGELEAWPRYLVSGPGTFTFSDGASPSTNAVSFGPLLEDQVALVTTLPRLRGVVDVSPTAPQAQELTKFQKFIKKLSSLASNNNTPPLLESWESSFGILPPQGPLYSLLEGRFTTPIKGKDNDAPAEVSNIAVTITDGNADSKIIAAVTPRRRWPM